MADDVVVTSNLPELVKIIDAIPITSREKVFRRVAKEIENDILKEFRRTTATWHHKPDFVVITDEHPLMGVDIIAGTDDEIYEYVDKGTLPHVIEPRGSGYPLVFQEAYNPKTIPGVLDSKHGGPYGPMRAAMIVHHPGTQARGFTRDIMLIVQKRLHDLLLKRAGEWIRKWKDKLPSVEE